MSPDHDRDCLCAHTDDYAFRIVLFVAPPSIGSNSRRGPSRFLNHASLSESPMMGSPGKPSEGDIHDQVRDCCDRRNLEDGAASSLASC
jgi:hypothetical protein